MRKAGDLWEWVDTKASIAVQHLIRLPTTVTSEERCQRCAGMSGRLRSLWWRCQVTEKVVFPSTVGKKQVKWGWSWLLMILAFSGWYYLWCCTAASTAAVWTQCWHWRQSFASLLVSGCVPLGAGWHFSLPELWTVWQEEDWVCVQFWRCRRLMNISAVSKKEVT